MFPLCHSKQRLLLPLELTLISELRVHPIVSNPHDRLRIYQTLRTPDPQLLTKLPVLLCMSSIQRPDPPSPKRGSINCTICPGGYSCSTPSALPVACNEGEYSAGGASACLTCPAGSYCPGPPYEEDSIQACPPGRYSPGGTSLCSECPKGYYCPDASQVPEACPDGYFADAGNQTSCDRCEKAGVLMQAGTKW